MREVLHIGLVTGSRADWGIWLPVLDGLKQYTDWKVQIICTGSHTFSGARDVMADSGYTCFHKVETPEPGENLEGLESSLHQTRQGFIHLFTKWKPDVLLLLGDRYEMYAASGAALQFQIPMVHFHGGETTEGAIDDFYRTEITAVSDLHFVASETFREKVIHSGKSPETVINSGAPGLDRFRNMDIPDRNSILQTLGLPAHAEYFLLTFHPVTRLPDLGAAERDALIEAFRISGERVVITLGSGDPAYQSFGAAFRKFAAECPDQVLLIPSAGENVYPALMKHAQAVVGNSSSGLIEAPYFKVPVLNVGIRQKGRLSTTHTVHVPGEMQEILHALKIIRDTSFLAMVKQDRNPYGEGNAVGKIIPALKAWMDEKL